MPDLIDLTAKAFAPAGTLAQVLKRLDRPYAVNPQQVRYADLTAKAFLGDGDLRGFITCLQGETGVGKTLGYTIPMCLHLAMTQRRGLVSTHTLHLQRQIVGREFEVAAAVAKELTGVSLTIAPQKGRRNFVSVSRIQALRDALHEAGALDDAAKEALESLAAFPSGDIGEWKEMNDLPSSIKPADICLLPGADNEESAAYNAHLEAARSANILVVTHALLMRFCMQWNALHDEESGMDRFDVAVLDEADELPSAADSVFNTRISAPMIEGIGENLKKFGFGGVSDLSGKMREWMDVQYNALRLNYSSPFRRDGAGGFVLLGGRRAEDIRDEARDLADMLSSQLRKGASAAIRKGMLREDAAEIEATAQQLTDFVKACDKPGGDRSVPAIRWSPVKSYGAFSTVPLWPGRLVSTLWADRKEGPKPFLRSIIMTSATLDAPGATASRFFGFKLDVGISDKYNHYNEAGSMSLAPDKFGKMDFVLADRRVPVPRDDTTEENASNPKWISYVGQCLAEAKSRGGRSLVILPSYRDTEAIAEAARDLGVDLIEHRRGSRVTDYLESFLNDPNGMLITPAAWQGLDLPGQLSHVIIPRVPYPVVDSAKNQARLDAFAMRGHDGNKANGFLFAYSSDQSRRKLKQGIGRLLRSVTDKGTVWILDPRFPLPETITSNRRLRQSNLPKSSYMAMAACIPERFRKGIAATYADAEIFPYVEAAVMAAE